MFFNDPYDVRVVERKSDPPTLEATVKRWAEVNDCELGVPDVSLRACPSPLILSTAGGASRAGFLTAAVLGRLMDQTTIEVSASNKDPELGGLLRESTLSYSPDGGCENGRNQSGACWSHGSCQRGHIQCIGSPDNHNIK
jgi:hypothetical protein